ncbi:MAG: Hsp70 family protein, partial [Candidatus Krumholzibacteria bacterium]|nr:Hsp70 family protein [Candidatus Krumholzibacteria bacterium]
MIDEAEKYAEEDRTKRDYSECLNEAEILLYSTEQTIKDFADRFSASELEEIHAAMEELREARDGDDRETEPLKQATGRLQAIMHKFAELMYSAPDSPDSLT